MKTKNNRYSVPDKFGATFPPMYVLQDPDNRILLWTLSPDRRTAIARATFSRETGRTYNMRIVDTYTNIPGATLPAPWRVLYRRGWRCRKVRVSLSELKGA